MRKYVQPLVLLLLFSLILRNLPADAQSNRMASVDSLRQALRQGKPDTNRVRALLQLGTMLLLKPGEEPVDLDEALSLARQAKTLSQKLNYAHGHGSSYLLFSQVYREKGLPKIGKKYAEKAIEFLRLLQASDALGDAYLEHRHYYSAFSKDELPKRIRWAEQALAAFKQSGNRLKQADTLVELGDLYNIQGNTQSALLLLKKALVIYQAIGYRPLQAIYDLLNIVSSELGDYKEGVRYGLLAIETAEKLGDSTTMVCTIYNRVGLTYFFTNNYEKSVFYFQKGLALAFKLNDRQAILPLSYNLCNGLISLKRPKEALVLMKKVVREYPVTTPDNQIMVTAIFISAYIDLKQYNQAGLYFNRMLQVEPNTETVLFYNIATDYLSSTHQYNRARDYLKKFQVLADQRHLSKEASLVQWMWFRLDSAQGNYLSAIGHYQKYKTLEDSLLSEAKSRQIANLEVKYETGKKEQDIKLKQERISRLTEKNNVQQTQRNALIGGSGLLVIILLLGFNRYRLKQRSNQQLQAQQQKLQVQHQELQIRQEEINNKNSTLQLLLMEKEWLLKEIHHRVKNNLQVVMSLLNSQANYLADDSALSAIQESQHRVQAMALIHQKLYQSEHVARIPMPSYIEEVVAYLRDAYDLPQPITFKLSIDPIELDVTQAVPLGLIINEAITNALKYAFPGGRSGTIRVVFHRLVPALFELRIEDDGIGLPPDYDPSRSRSLGMTLIQGFSQQLGGELEIRNVAGLTISLQFQDEQLTLTENRLTQ